MKIPTMDYISRVHQNIFIQWEPSVAQGTHNYSHCLPTLCRKLRFELFSPIKVDPLSLLRLYLLNLESQNEAKKISLVLPSYLIGQGVHELWSNIKKTNRDYNFISIDETNDSHNVSKVAEQYEIGFFESGPFQKLYIKHV